MKSDIEANVFHEYAQVYDDLYRDKDYRQECDLLINTFQRFGETQIHHLLDMGCGTGNHAILMAQRGYEVCGIDRSPEMISIARQKSAGLQLAGGVSFEIADLQNAQVGRLFDAAACMFAVLSYMTENNGIFATLQTARRHLKEGGLFIADFWYGPAVLSIRPEERVKIIKGENSRTVRIARPSMNTEKDTVTVSYHILRLQKQTLTAEMHEDHIMRYFFLPEINFMLHQAGFDLLHVCPFPNLDGALNENDWNAMIVARAI